MKQQANRVVLLALALALLQGCSEPERAQAALPSPSHFTEQDQCHVCSMAIEGFPGPKGQAIGNEGQPVHKFCSTRDLLSWVLQPENRNRDLMLYVHDMAQTTWEHPADTALIDARNAYYVVGSQRTGAMGPTLATFSKQTDARTFVGEHGGSVIAFSDLEMKHLRMSHGSVEE